MVAGVISTEQRLKDDLPEALLRAHEKRRPLLIHLNADTTWLLSLPYPAEASTPAGRVRYNILIDPWLQGPQSDVASWFSTQWHLVKSSVQSIAELNEILSIAESKCLESSQDESKIPSDEVRNRVDLVAISHEFTDHCHEATLKELDPNVPVFATTEARNLIKSWKHFDIVHETPAFTEDIDWRSTSVPPLPSWLGVSRLTTPGNALYYHSALVMCLKNDDSSDNAEAVIYTPHGVSAETFGAIATAKPTVTTLAFLHGLHDVSIKLSKQLNLGAHNGLKAQKVLKSRYWVGTHDEVKKGGGLIGPMLRRKIYSISDALSKDRGTGSGLNGSTKALSAEDVAWVDLGNGQTLLLE